MAMKAAVSDGDRPGNDEGVLRLLWEHKGEVAARARAGNGGVVAERPEEEAETVRPAHQ
jgi:hypothetical protein